MTLPMPIGVHPPIPGFAAWSGAGRTTLRRLPVLAERQTDRTPEC